MQVRTHTVTGRAVAAQSGLAGVRPAAAAAAPDASIHGVTPSLMMCTLTPQTQCHSTLSSRCRPGCSSWQRW